MRRVLVDLSLDGVGPVQAYAMVLPSDARDGIPRRGVIWLVLRRPDGTLVDPNDHRQELALLFDAAEGEEAEPAQTAA